MDNRVTIVNDIVYVDGVDVIEVIKKLCRDNDSLFKENQYYKSVIKEMKKILIEEKGEENDNRKSI